MTTPASVATHWDAARMWWLFALGAGVTAALLLVLSLRRRRAAQWEEIARERARLRACALSAQERELADRAAIRRRQADADEARRADEQRLLAEASLEKKMAVARKTGILTFLPRVEPSSQIASLAPTIRALLLHGLGARDEDIVCLADVAFPNLSTLDLSGNELRQLWRGRPWNTPALKRLIVQRNGSLTALPETGWITLTKLRELKVDACALETLPSSLGHLKALLLLNVSRNRLRALPAELGALVELKDLDASSNRLATLPAEMAGMSQLRRLNVENNHLTRVPREILDIQTLEDIRVRGNALVALKSMDGVDEYLQRRLRRVIEDGCVLAFRDLEVRHQREMQKREVDRARREAERF